MIALAGGTTDCCGEPLSYHFTLSRVSDTVVPDTNRPQTIAGLRKGGLQGWAAGIATEFADVNGDTVADGFICVGTAVDVNPLWGWMGFAGSSGLSSTKPFPSFSFCWEFVDPAVNGGKVGRVVGFVHGLDGCTTMEFGELPLEGAESLMRLVYVSFDGDFRASRAL